MFQWSEKQQPVLRALEMPELVNCYVYHGIFPAWESLSAGVCGCPGKAQEQPTSFHSQEEKIQGFGEALSPLSFRPAPQSFAVFSMEEKKSRGHIAALL